MGRYALLAPVGPFAGLSNSAQRRAAQHFDVLPIVEIERAAEHFCADLQAPMIDPRLAEVREELEAFSKELARFKAAVDRLKIHRLNDAIGEACRMSGSAKSLSTLERLVQNLQSAAHHTARSVPHDCAELASRRLVARLAKLLRQRASPGAKNGRDALVAMITLIFEDLMVGGDAEFSVRDWEKTQLGDGNRDPVGRLIELVVA